VDLIRLTGTMAEKRYIYKKITINGKLAQCSDIACLMYSWIIPFQDGFGCYTADPLEIKKEIFKKRDHITEELIFTSMQELEKVGLVSVGRNPAGKMVMQMESYQRAQPHRADRQRTSIYGLPGAQKELSLDIPNPDMPDKKNPDMPTVFNTLSSYSYKAFINIINKCSYKLNTINNTTNTDNNNSGTDVKTEPVKQKSPIAELNDYYFIKLEGKITRPHTNFGISGRIFKNLLTTQTVEDIKKAIDIYFKTTDSYIIDRTYDVKLFMSGYNQYKSKQSGGKYNARMQRATEAMERARIEGDKKGNT